MPQENTDHQGPQIRSRGPTPRGSPDSASGVPLDRGSTERQLRGLPTPTTPSSRDRGGARAISFPRRLYPLPSCAFVRWAGPARFVGAASSALCGRRTAAGISCARLYFPPRCRPALSAPLVPAFPTRENGRNVRKRRVDRQPSSERGESQEPPRFLFAGEASRLRKSVGCSKNDDISFFCVISSFFFFFFRQLRSRDISPRVSDRGSRREPQVRSVHTIYYAEAARAHAAHEVAQIAITGCPPTRSDGKRARAGHRPASSAAGATRFNTPLEKARPPLIRHQRWIHAAPL